MDGSIGDLFRDYGEQYIEVFKPPLQHIKVIRSIRICKTPFLGGNKLECKTCGKERYIYFSCGNSHCPLCQNDKRLMWQAKVEKKMLNVPYVHGVFTTPKELHGLMKTNPRVMYNIVIRAAWNTIKKLCAQPKNVGGLPGMICVLHTFGSDMKYHVHLHSLITFGGVDEKNGSWRWPVHAKKLASFKEMKRTYRKIFIEMILKACKKGELKIIDENDYASTIETIKNKSWNVRMEYPTANVSTIQRYLARYINRVAISKNRLEYVAKKEQTESYVQIQYKDYNRQEKGEAAPMASRKIDSLVAIGKFMQHILPPYCQKSRYYGLHSASIFKRLKDKIPKEIVKNGQTVKKLFELLRHLNGLDGYKCDECEGEEFDVEEIRPQRRWIYKFLKIPENRGPPRKITTKLSSIE